MSKNNSSITHPLATESFENTTWPTTIDDGYQNSKDTPSRARALLNLGVLYWRRGDLERSERLITSAKDISTNMRDASFLAQCFTGLGLVKSRLNKIDDAIDAYQSAIKLDPKNFHLWNNLGNLYLNHDQLEKAISAFNQSIYTNSQDAVAWNGLANAYYQNGSIDEAIDAYNRALALMQNTPQEKFLNQWLHLAVLYSKKGQYSDAINFYRRILAIDPNKADIWYEVGLLYIKTRAYEKSIQPLSKAVELNPDYGKAYLNLGYAYSKLNKHKDSVPYFLKSIERLKSQREKKLASTLMEKSMSIVKNNPLFNTFQNKDGFIFSGTVKDLESWFYINYKEDMTTTNLVSSEDNVERLPSMKIDTFTSENNSPRNGTLQGEGNLLRKMLKSPTGETQAEGDNNGGDPDGQSAEIVHPEIWNEKGNIHFNSQNYEAAIASFQKAIELDPSFGKSYNNLALVNFIKGNYKLSITLYKKSIELLNSDHEKAIAWNGLGHVYRCLKDYESARLAYQNASELDRQAGGVHDPDDLFEVDEENKTVEFWNELGKLLFKSGAYKKAASAFHKAIQLEPSSGQTYGYLARALTVQGRYEEAASLYRKCIELIISDLEKANTWNRLGDVYRKLNDYDNALKAYQNASELRDDRSSVLNRTRRSLLSNYAAK